MHSRFFLVLSISFTAAAAGPKLQLGTPSALWDGLREENTRLTSRYSLTTSSGQTLKLRIQDFHQEGGYASMTGEAPGSPHSEFILKGTPKDIYGWLVLRDRNVAYEYTTDTSGRVVVEQVPVEKIFPVCAFPGEAPQSGPEPPALLKGAAAIVVTPDALTPHVGVYPAGTDVLRLQSLPGAPKVFFIDYSLLTDRGETVPRGQTATDVWQTWQSLAAALSAFNVNVTTDRAVYTAAGVANSGRASMRDVNGGTSSCALNIIGTTTACQVNRYNNGYATGRILSHEVGHGVGLSHDGGQPGGEYFEGLPAFQWTPLMGNVWPGDRWANALYQYSRGEYNTATQQQDDWAIINRHFQFRPDDVLGTEILRIQGTSVPAMQNRGQIQRNNDSDSFSFQIGSGGGRAQLEIDRIEYYGGAMLDVEAVLRNASGALIVRANPTAARNALIDQTLTAGSYVLTIKGGAEGTPQNGFSNYSSVGWYGIQGTITGAIVTPIAQYAGRDGGIVIRPVSRDGRLRIEVPPGARIGKTLLVSATGGMLFRSSGPTQFIDLSGMAAGNYLLSIAVDGMTVTRKVVKE